MWRGNFGRPVFFIGHERLVGAATEKESGGDGDEDKDEFHKSISALGRFGQGFGEIFARLDLGLGRPLSLRALVWVGTSAEH